MNAIPIIIVGASVYLAVGVVVGFVHPSLFRWLFVDIKNTELVRGGVFWKPILALVFFVLICVLWPIAWFNARKAERALAAKLERLRPFGELHAAMNHPVRYAGGDGSSFEDAVVIVGANMLSGMRAEHDYIVQHHPGYELRTQALKEHEGRKFDVFELVGAAGDDRVLYFDISGFHAKPPTTISPIPKNEVLCSSRQRRN